ncbi:MAG: hypothetical protein LC802_09830 [Acidobacteria bacterium]|nr:hypothetical protein [Acidobacteriota bacterium]
MPSRKRPVAVLAMILLALSASVYTSSEASSRQNRQQQPAPTPQRPPTLTLDADTQVVTLCPDAESTANPRVRLKAVGHSPDGNPLTYRWKVSGGRLEGEGTDVVWDLSNAAPGVYSADVTLESGPSGDPLCTAFTSTKVVVRNCPPPRPFCPNVSIYCPDITQAGAPVTFTASVNGGTPGVTPIYNWKVSAGRITAGQGTATITVDTAGLAGQPITATVEVAGYNLECARLHHRLRRQAREARRGPAPRHPRPGLSRQDARPQLVAHRDGGRRLPRERLDRTLDRPAGRDAPAGQVRKDEPTKS